MAEYQIRDLLREPASGGKPAYYTARLVIGKTWITVDNRNGSWLARFDGLSHSCDLMPEVAAALQAKVRPLERRLKRDRASVCA